MSTESAVRIRDDESSELKVWISDVADGVELVDGGETGPHQCSGDRTGLEYYTKAWVIEPKSGTMSTVLENFESAMRDRGYEVDGSQADSARPSVVFFNNAHEVRVTEYAELAALRFTLITTCGAAG